MRKFYEVSHHHFIKDGSRSRAVQCSLNCLFGTYLEFAHTPGTIEIHGMYLNLYLSQSNDAKKLVATSYAIENKIKARWLSTGMNI